MMTLRTLTMFLTLAWAGAALAARQDEFALPDFKSLQGQAVDSVDLTLGPSLLRFAGTFMDDSDADAAAVKKLLAGITSIRVRSLRFDHDRSFSDSDLEGLREQLAGPHWIAVLNESNRKDGQRLDIRVRVEDAEARGLAVIATQPREFTIVYIVGFLNPADLPRLLHGLHMPTAGMDVGAATAVPTLF